MPRGLKKFLSALGWIFDGFQLIAILIDLGKLIGSAAQFVFSLFP